MQRCFQHAKLAWSLGCLLTACSFTQPQYLAHPLPEAMGLVPDSPPDSISMSAWQAMYAPQNMVRSSSEWAFPFPRNTVQLLFREETSRVEKQRAVDAIRGVVVGGAPIGRGGFYFVRISDDGTSRPLFRAIQTLRSFPQVESASPVLPAPDLLQHNTRRP
jgi:hypothetical protein